MEWIVTPGQLERRSELYHQLGVLTAAGLTFHQSLDQLRRNPPSRSFVPILSQWQESLGEGYTIAKSLERIGAAHAFDLALIEAGEQSGRLDVCMKLLALYYHERARMVKQVISDLLYPLFILHFAAVLFPFMEFFRTGNWLKFIGTILAILFPIYAVTGFVIFAAQGKHGEQWRAGFERFLHPVPVIGTARRYLALARLSAALEALLNAGVSIVPAWELAATASGSPALQRLVGSWRSPLEQGLTPSELVTNSGVFPDVFCNLYHTGEVSGQLDQTLLRLHTFYQEEGFRKMHLVAKWGPQLIYLTVMIIVGWKIIQTYIRIEIDPLKEIEKGF